MSSEKRHRGYYTRAELLTFVALGLIGAAVATPKLMRADLASDEAKAIADARRVSNAEEAYAAANLGFYSDVTNLCRSGPECRGIGIPGYPDGAPEFLSPDLGRVSPFLKDDYDHTWTAGSPPYPSPAAADPESVMDYCYNVVPHSFPYPWPHPDWPRGFALDESGRIFFDPTGVQIACPIPYGTDLLETPRPALAVDFGRRGLWRYDGGNRWIKLARSNAALVRAWGETLVATFEGRKGLYLLDAAGWRRIHPRRATDVVPLGVNLVARFQNLPGLWHWDHMEWTQISTWEPEAIEVQGNKLLVDFGPAGLWLFWKPLGWTQFSDRDPSYIRADQRHYYADLADGQGVQWLYFFHLQDLRIWWDAGRAPTPQPEATLEFPGEHFSWNHAEDLGVAGGTWLNYQQVSTWDPYLLSHLDTELVAAFRGRGLHHFEDETSWVEVTSSEPSELAPADTYVGARFNDLKGVYRVDDAGLQRLTGWKTQSVTAIDLAAPSHAWTLRRARQCPVPKLEPETCRRLVRRRGWP